jgi:hypothetical protein
MRNFDRQFNFTSGIIKAVFVIMIIFMIGMFGFRISRMASGKPQYQITAPTYSNTSPDIYFTEHYIERNGCIEFKDEFGFEQKICGAYQVRKW